MDTSTGRFISQDSYTGSTADPVSLHKYLYANSNPVTYSDPSGYTSLGEMVCVSAVIGGIAGATINAAGYLDSLLSWRDFDFNTMLQSAFEGFLCGMTMGALFGVGLYSLSYVCMVFPALSGLDTAFVYAFGLWNSYQSISSGITQFNNGNYASAVTLGFWGYLSGFALMQSIFTNYFSNDITSIAEQNKTLAEEQAKNNKSFSNSGTVTNNNAKQLGNELKGKSVAEVEKYLNDSGYTTNVRGSSKSTSKAVIIEVSNTGGTKNVSQVQVSPGGGRHGPNPYIKFSTTDQGIIKLVYGSSSTYKTDGSENATIIFVDE